MIDFAALTSLLSAATPKASQCARLVIWQRIKSAPEDRDNHHAGRRFPAAGSFRGNELQRFAGDRFDHAASSSGEFQSRPRTDRSARRRLNTHETGKATSVSVC